MLSTVFLYGGLFLVWILPFIVAIQARNMAAHALQRSSERLARNIQLNKLTDIQTEITEHADSIESLHTSLKKLRSRVGMRALRDRNAKKDDDIPDHLRDPEGYKREMRKKLRANGTLK